MTGDLAVWLRAQLDADEQTARACVQTEFGASGRWATFDKAHLSPAVVFALQGWDDSKLAQVCNTETSWIGKEAREHIARHDPAFTLADITAKRAIIDLHRVIPSWGNRPCCEVCSAGGEYGVAGQFPCATLRLLAQPYAGRPGWHNEWNI